MFIFAFEQSVQNSGIMLVAPSLRAEVKKTGRISYGHQPTASRSTFAFIRSFHLGLGFLGTAVKAKALAGVLVSALLIGVVAFASPSASAMSVSVSSSGNSSFNTHQMAVFHVQIKVQSGELVPITSLSATIQGQGTPNSVSVSTPSFPANHAVTDFDGAPFIQAVSASGFMNATSCSNGYGYGYSYGCGVQGPATNNYIIQVSTSSLAQMAGLTSGQTGTFALTITVHTSTGDMVSSPVTFTITSSSGSSGHGH
jgi:hypothetical protein